MGKRQITHRQVLLDKLNWPNVRQIIMAASVNLARKAGFNNSSQGLNNEIRKKNPKSQRNNNEIRLSHSGPANRKPTNFSANATSEFNSLPHCLKDP